MTKASPPYSIFMLSSPPLPDYVVLDTCVLVSNTVRQLLLRMAQHHCLAPVWGDYIGEEWRRNIPHIWGVSGDYAQRQWAFMQEAFPMANMGSVHAFEEGLKHSDPKDHHVIACGRAMQHKAPGKVIAILTWNIKDFNRKELRDLGLYLYTPDQYLCLLWPTHQDLMIELFEFFSLDNADIAKPALSISEYLGRERLFALRKCYEAKLSG